ncbi:MAG: PASTA domain-containing protein [Bacteroidales bacterium]
MTLKEFLKTRTFKLNALAALGITIFLILFVVVFLRIYTDHGDSVEIPDLKGKSMEETANILDDKDLRYEIQDSVYSPDLPPGTVLDQFPKPGMKVKQNRMIFITLCAISQVKIPMPQLTDISLRQAESLIENAGLTAGSIQYKQSEFPNLVLEQRINGRMIAKGEMIPKGSRVDLVVGSDADGLTIELPSLIGLSLNDAKLKVEEKALSLGTITYDESVTSEDQKEQAVIWKQSPDPATTSEIDRGSALDIWMTIDPNKIQENPEKEKPDNSFF